MGVVSTGQYSTMHNNHHDSVPLLRRAMLKAYCFGCHLALVDISLNQCTAMLRCVKAAVVLSAAGIAGSTTSKCCAHRLASSTRSRRRT
jgi:hypothetical protein